MFGQQFDILTKIRFLTKISIFEKKSIFKLSLNSQAVALSTPPGSQWAIICPTLFLALLVGKKNIFL